MNPHTRHLQCQCDALRLPVELASPRQHGGGEEGYIIIQVLILDAHYNLQYRHNFVAKLVDRISLYAYVSSNVWGICMFGSPGVLLLGLFLRSNGESVF